MLKTALYFMATLMPHGQWIQIHTLPLVVMSSCSPVQLYLGDLSGSPALLSLLWRQNILAISEAAKQAIWLRRLVKDCTGKAECVSIFADNQTALKTASNSIKNSRTKHIGVRYHAVVSYVEREKVKIVYVPTSDNVADILTKPLKRIQFSKLSLLLGVHQ